MNTVTDLGDAAVTMPVAAILFAAFLSLDMRTAGRWATAVAACGLIVASGKLALYMFGDPAALLRSPSGHAAASALVYGALPSLAGGRRAIPIAAGLVLTIAASRFYLEKHTQLDILVGLAIGLSCLAWFLSGPRGDTSLAGRPWTLSAGCVACLSVCAAGTLLHWRLPIDPWLRIAAARLAG